MSWTIRFIVRLQEEKAEKDVHVSEEIRSEVSSTLTAEGDEFKLFSQYPSA